MTPYSPFKTCLLWLAAVATVILCARVVETAAAQSARHNPDDITLLLPTRRAPDAPPAPPPGLLPGADDIKPLTLEVVIEGRARQVVRQTLARTKDRIHLRAGDKEWLFERNAIDPRRVSAHLVDHATRTIVRHEESDLRNRLGIAGWADILMLGLDGGALARLAPTAESRTEAGIRFRKYAARGTEPGMAEIWWSDDLLLPAAFVIRDAAGATSVTVRRIRAGVDPALLALPSSRFRDYREVDLAEWLEGH